MCLFKFLFLPLWREDAARIERAEVDPRAAQPAGAPVHLPLFFMGLTSTLLGFALLLSWLE